MEILMVFDQLSLSLVSQQDISQHRLSDLTQHELSLLRVDREQQVTSSSSTSNEKPAKTSRLSERAKKKSWYNVIYPNYKSRAEDFKKLFKDVPNDERLIVGEFSCGPVAAHNDYLCFSFNEISHMQIQSDKGNYAYMSSFKGKLCKSVCDFIYIYIPFNC